MGRKAKGPELGTTFPRVRLAATMIYAGIIAPIPHQDGRFFLESCVHGDHGSVR